MLGPNLPFSVGIIGAQKTIADPFSDVATNIRGAFDTLQLLSEQNVHMPFVFDSGGAYNAAAIVKRSDSEDRIFDSPGHPPILTTQNFASTGLKPTFTETSGRGTFAPVVMSDSVPLLDIAPQLGVDPAVYENMVRFAPSDAAIAVHTFGSYTLPLKALHSIEAAAQAEGKLLFTLNRIPGGSSAHIYADSESIRQSSLHCVDMSRPALQAKYHLARTLFGSDLEKIADFVVNTNYVGEVPPRIKPTRNI